MNVLGIIPARMGSSRFPGKPLARICGKPMIEHVYKRCQLSKTLDDLFIATCDLEIKEATERFGGKAIMTKGTHEGASDRVAEAMLIYERENNKKVDAVVMIQGDEPMIFPEMISQSCDPVLAGSSIKVTNLMAPIKSREEYEDPNEIKVVVDKNNLALFFSRRPIPMSKKGDVNIPMLKQVCIITFRRDFLLEFNEMVTTPLERVEGIDMLRVLENGYSVKMVPTEFETYSVDNLEDLKRVERCLEKDELLEQYLSEV